MFFLNPLCTFNFFTIAQIIEVRTEKKIEDDDVSYLSLSNTTKNENVLNATSTDLATSNDNEATSNLNIKTNDTNYNDFCAKKCSCETCKDALSNSLSSIENAQSNQKLEQERVNKSSKGSSVPTFGK